MKKTSVCFTMTDRIDSVTGRKVYDVSAQKHKLSKRRRFTPSFTLAEGLESRDEAYRVFLTWDNSVHHKAMLTQYFQGVVV